MAWRKVSCLRWILVLLVIVCPLVYSRPQEITTFSPTSVSFTPNVNEKPPESLHRYKYKETSLLRNIDFNIETPSIFGNIDFLYSVKENKLPLFGRQSRLVKKVKVNKNKATPKQKNNKERLKLYPVALVSSSELSNRNTVTSSVKRLPIKKIFTKWTDEANIDELTKYSYQIDNKDHTSTEAYMSTETTNDNGQPTIFNNVEHSHKIKSNNFNRYRPQYTEETQVYSGNINIVDTKTPMKRPTFIYTTPNPTPVISNIGHPNSWYPSQEQHHYSQYLTNKRPFHTKKPYNQQENYNNAVYNSYTPIYLDQDVFDVTTIAPTASAYTEKIVIRPEEYNASNEDCPTIYLTLNNTFQGQAKGACPDLNIAVNTNVVNKNVVIESEEEENENLFPGVFGLGEDSDSNEGMGNDFFEPEAIAESASVENAELTNYNSAGSSNSASLENMGMANSPLSSYAKPNKPNKNDDSFSFSSLMQFFRPAINAMGWLATLSPLSFGLFSLFLAPIAFLLAGTTGITALFAPWALPYARESPQEIHIYRPYYPYDDEFSEWSEDHEYPAYSEDEQMPQWQWDDEIKTWKLNSTSASEGGDKNWFPRFPRNKRDGNISQNKKKGKPTWFFKVKHWLKNITKLLKEKERSQIKMKIIKKPNG